MMRINYDDERFVDNDYLAHHKLRRLRIDPPSGEHDAVVVAANGRTAWIDVNIAELVHLLWRHDVTTDDSCGDVFHTGPVWALLGFPDVEHLRHFINVSVPPDDTRPGGIADRATGGALHPEHPDVWQYQLGVYRSVHRALLPCTVDFPATDLPAMAAHLRRNL
jgi:hypothetical protein